MKALCILLLSAGLVSCGLETVASLASPNVDYLQTTDTVLSFEHSASRYDTPPFQGYVVYYKVYPLSDIPDFSRLLSDRSSLSTSPTVNQLYNLGYRAFTASGSSAGTSSGVESLLLEPSDGDEVTLDFSDFIQNPSDTNQPLLKYDGSNASKPYLYRTAGLVGTSNQTFDSLRTATARSEDMAVLTADQLAAHEFEINVFIAAYGVTSDLVEVYSSPVPWGVIRTVD